MGENAVVDLIMALTARLSAVADEFTTQARQLATDGALIDDLGEYGRGGRATRLLAERRKRARFLPEHLFDEPGWNMLLALFIARQEQRPMTMKQLIGAADVPVTTAQRWVDQLVRLGLIERSVDAEDRRRVGISLSERGEDAMQRYLDDLDA